jgi:hypothetical protein
MHRSFDPLTGRSISASPRRQPSPLRSKEIVVTLETSEQRVKAFRIDWLPSEVGFSVGFPYFSPPHAVLGRYELVVPPGGRSAVSLLEGGRVTTQHVKLSFHKSGTVLFSQTKKIQSVIRNQSSSLLGRVDYLFSVHVRGPGGFKLVDAQDGPSPAPSRAVWNLESNEPGDAGFKIVGRWFPLEMLEVAQSQPGFFGRPNFVRLRLESGEIVSGCLFTPIPTWRWGGYALLLSDEPWSIREGHPDPYILVAGGFARRSKRGEPDSGLTFLAGMYTDRSTEIEELTRTLGTVDLVSD